MKPVIQVILLVAFAAFFMTGCSIVPTAWNYGAKANDAALAGAEKALCKGASYGAVIRRYGLNSPKAIARRVLCGFNSGSSVAQ